MVTSSSNGKLAHRFHTGSFFPELESALANEIAGFKREHGPLAPVTILVPTNLLKIYLPRRLAESFGGHANLRFQTLTDLIRSLTPADARPLPQFADELIIAGLIAKRVTKGSYFYPVREGLGFRSALLSAIRDLKQADISSLDLRKSARSLNRPKFTQLADLYEAYESTLRELGFSDDDDLLKLAIQTPSTQHPALSTRLLIYGFYDFNHLQRELIAALVRQVSTTVFMPYHPTGGAYQYVEPTKKWFEQILGVEAEHYADIGDAELPPTLVNLRSGLFLGRELQQVEKPNPKQVTILSTPGEAREAREMIREAVRFSDAHESPLYHAAVLARSLDNYAGPLRDCAASRGYSVHVNGGQSLLQQAAAQALLLIPRIVHENFSRQTVLEFLSLAPIRVDAVLAERLRPGYVPSAWGQISAEAGIVRGMDSWQQRTSQWIKARIRRKGYAEKSGEPVSAQQEQRLLAAQAMEVFMQNLSTALRGVPAAGKWSTLVGAVERVARQFLRPSEELEEALGCVRKLTDLEPVRETIELGEFIDFVRKALDARRVSDARFEEGGLFVGGLENCRGVTWPMVVIPGLIESSFPRVVREDPILLDQERMVINDVIKSADSPSPLSSPPAGRGKRVGRLSDGSPVRDNVPSRETASHIPSPLGGEGRVRGVVEVSRLPLKIAGHDEERLLFQLAVESARERLVLTYPRLDPFTGSQRVPSILLLHTIEALRGGTANFSSLEDDPLHHVVPLQEITTNRPSQELLDAGEYDLATIHASLARGVRTLKPYLDSVSPWIGRGLGCERKRWGSPVFTEFDGVFTSKESREILARSFENRVWAVTALERFARCPYLFFLTDVLGIEEFEEPEDAETISAQDLGSLWHDILRDVVRRFQEEKLWPLRAADRKRQLDLMHKIAAEHFLKFDREGVTGYAILWEVCREKLTADLEAWLGIESETDSHVPLHVESSLPAAQVFGVPIKGRVDRIDAAVRGGEWRVYDYKTGGKAFKARSFNKGLALQIPLYMLAIVAGQNQKVSDGYYLYVTRRGGLKRIGWTREELRAAEPSLQKLVQEIIVCIRVGRFFLTNQVPDVAGVTLPEAALGKLMEIKQADPQWLKLESLLEEEAGEDE
ncbi:MAG: hypothetical protein EXS18_00435 [Verrucomicrobiae bacterium]|nr:hypothetical protein [Verrucomicrobiae bacterium]